VHATATKGPLLKTSPGLPHSYIQTPPPPNIFIHTLPCLALPPVPPRGFLLLGSPPLCDVRAVYAQLMTVSQAQRGLGEEARRENDRRDSVLAQLTAALDKSMEDNTALALQVSRSAVVVVVAGGGGDRGRGEEAPGHVAWCDTCASTHCVPALCPGNLV
jgi:hypothetical protein